MAAAYPTREKFIKDIAKINRWDIYNLFWTLFQTPSPGEAKEVTWRLLYALNRERDAEIGRKDKLLDANSEKEFPFMRAIYNACYGDFYLINKTRGPYFFVSYQLPEAIFQYLDIDPVSGEYTPGYNKELLKIKGISPVDDVLGIIGGFLGLKDTQDYPWAEYPTTQEYKNALRARRALNQYDLDMYIETADEYYNKQFFHVTDDVTNELITDRLMHVFQNPTNFEEYLEAWHDYRSMINKPFRSLLIGPEEVLTENLVITINLD